MSVYSINYDLNMPGQNYSGLLAELAKFPGVHYLKSAWLIATNLSVEGVFDRLARHIDKSDKLLVIEVASPYKGWLDTSYWPWIKTHLG